jgi:hypothetical protein
LNQSDVMMAGSDLETNMATEDLAGFGDSFAVPKCEKCIALKGQLNASEAERQRLQAALISPETVTAEPAEDYPILRKQFLALRTLANSNARMVQHWRDQCGRETREALLANAANVNAERETNQVLTEALLVAEAERDQLRSEIESLRRSMALSEALARARA